MKKYLIFHNKTIFLYAQPTKIHKTSKNIPDCAILVYHNTIRMQTMGRNTTAIL